MIIRVLTREEKKAELKVLSRKLNKEFAGEYKFRVTDHRGRLGIAWKEADGQCSAFTRGLYVKDMQITEDFEKDVKLKFGKLL